MSRALKHHAVDVVRLPAGRSRTRVCCNGSALWRREDRRAWIDALAAAKVPPCRLGHHCILTPAPCSGGTLRTLAPCSATPEALPFACACAVPAACQVGCSTPGISRGLAGPGNAPERPLRVPTSAVLHEHSDAHVIIHAGEMGREVSGYGRSPCCDALHQRVRPRPPATSPARSGALARQGPISGGSGHCP